MSLPGVRTQWDLPAKMPHNPPVLHHTIRKRGRRNRDSPSVSYNAADTTSIRILTDIEISERAAVSCKPFHLHPTPSPFQYHITSLRLEAAAAPSSPASSSSWASTSSAESQPSFCLLCLSQVFELNGIFLPLMVAPQAFHREAPCLLVERYCCHLNIPPPAMEDSTFCLPPNGIMPSRRTVSSPSQRSSSCQAGSTSSLPGSITLSRRTALSPSQRRRS
jgi:hypothetical protein